MSLATILRPMTALTATSSTDRYGDTIIDWSAPVSRTVNGWFQETSTTEDRDHRDARVVEGTGTFDIASAVQAGERIVIDGTTFDVVGAPTVRPTPRGPHHVEARLRSVVG